MTEEKTKRELVKIFEQIREIPYNLRLSADEEDNSCDGKHITLKSLFEASGYDVRWRTCLFKYESLPIPESILKLKPYEFYYHSFLEIFLENRWVILDATWDRDLANVLPVNFWDGASDTKIAVPYSEIFSPEESLEIVQKPRDENNINASLAKHREFYMALNAWFDTIRKNNIK